jgi:hypothetical protein
MHGAGEYVMNVQQAVVNRAAIVFSAEEQERTQKRSRRPALRPGGILVMPVTGDRSSGQIGDAARPDDAGGGLNPAPVRAGAVRRNETLAIPDSFAEDAFASDGNIRERAEGGYGLFDAVPEHPGEGSADIFSLINPKPGNRMGADFQIGFMQHGEL